MIFRRRHTANYTTIGNVLFEDKRLAADEVGILAFLLSRPHDWEVRRPALMRRWNIGRDATKRIITNWMRTGWCQARKTRISNGTFRIVYEIQDQPGKELTDDEIRRALSLVSSEAADDESDSENSPDQRPESGDPPTGEPGVVDRIAAGRSWPIEDSQTTESQRNDSTDSERETRARGDDKKPSVKRFLLKWPTAAIDDKAHITRAWEALPAEECEPCLDGIDRFLAELKKHGRKHVPAGWKYIEDRSWTLIDKPAGEPANPTFDCWSKEWWAVLLARIGRNAPVKFFVRYASEPGKRTTGEVAANMPGPQRLAEFKNYPSDGTEMKAWRPWFEAHGVNLPKWENRVWVFLPSASPPHSTSPPLGELSQEDIKAFD